MSGRPAVSKRHVLSALLLLPLIIAWIACARQRPVCADDNGDTGRGIALEGVFITRSFINKAGREYPTVRDWYFRTNDAEYFVRLDRSRVKAERLRQIAGKRVRVRAVKAFGLWDTDDPNVQSRVGGYLKIEEILEEGG